MNAFIRYMTNKKPTQFFFFDDIAFIRFSVRTDIVNISTGEVLDSLKVRHLSQVVYCIRHDIWFLKSVMGPVYAYKQEGKELKRICSTGNSDYAIFLNHDQSLLIVISDRGKFSAVDTKTFIKKNLYQSEKPCYFPYGWDNVKERSYTFLSDAPNESVTFTSVNYDGIFQSKQPFRIDGKQVVVHYLRFDPHYDFYLMQYSFCLEYDPDDNHSYDKLKNVQTLEEMYAFTDHLKEDIPDMFLSLAIGSLENRVILQQDRYAGGNPCSQVYKSYLFVSIGNGRIDLIDLHHYKVIKEFRVNTLVTHMQYDSFHNALFVSDDGFTVIHDVL